jgi:hypothetical protein
MSIEYWLVPDRQGEIAHSTTQGPALAVVAIVLSAGGLKALRRVIGGLGTVLQLQ